MLEIPKDKVEEEVRGSKANEAPSIQINATTNVTQPLDNYSAESEALNSNALAIAAVLQEVGGLPGQEAQEVEYKEIDDTKELMKDLTDKLNIKRKETQGEDKVEKLANALKDTISEHKGELEAIAENMTKEVIEKVKKPKATDEEKEANKDKN